jgi:glycerophosphoryl diester phosphodiesterase
VDLFPPCPEMPPPRPVIVAHRGLHAAYPENSREAMRAAWDAGVQWAECDVRESTAAGLIVLHDETLDRTTEATGPIDDWPDARPDLLRLRDSAGTITGHTLPRLRDLVHAMPTHGRLLLEIKAINDYAALIRDIGGRPVCVQSFDARSLLMTSRQDRSIPLAYLVETREDLEAAMKMQYPSVHLEQALLDERTHRRLRAAGKSIGVWTVNAEADVRRVVRLGVDMLITDEPALARGVIDELCGPA